MKPCLPFSTAFSDPAVLMETGAGESRAPVFYGVSERLTAQCAGEFAGGAAPLCPGTIAYEKSPLPNPPHKEEGLTRPRRLFQEWGACRVISPPFRGSEGRGETSGSTPVGPAGQRGLNLAQTRRTSFVALHIHPPAIGVAR